MVKKLRKQTTQSRSRANGRKHIDARNGSPKLQIVNHDETRDLEGCDIQCEESEVTRDEDLPIAKGGVEIIRKRVP